MGGLETSPLLQFKDMQKTPVFRKPVGEVNWKYWLLAYLEIISV